MKIRHYSMHREEINRFERRVNEPCKLLIIKISSKLSFFNSPKQIILHTKYLHRYVPGNSDNINEGLVDRFH
jgi:hypothetical protein